MASTLSEMTIAELETFRAEAQAQIEALREQCAGPIGQMFRHASRAHRLRAPG
jgi:hypothetical protein